MARWLNRLFIVLLFGGFFIQEIKSQETTVPDYDDYKDKDQFKKFYKRRKIIGAWQINQLKKGALIVRLKTNKKLIDGLISQGNTLLAKEKEVETFIMNKNTMMAYLHHYNFSKLYFIYSSSSDTLLRGAKTGIFLDTNLQVDAKIALQEDFYLIAERDYAYNSSIGFVPEDSANYIKENGNPMREMGVVIKNKYGHQLKSPFPYIIKDKTFADTPDDFIARSLFGTNSPEVYLAFKVENLKQESQIKNQHSASSNNAANDWIKVPIKKQYSYAKISIFVSQLNLSLKDYFQSTPPPDMSRIDGETKKFLY